MVDITRSQQGDSAQSMRSSVLVIELQNFGCLLKSQLIVLKLVIGQRGAKASAHITRVLRHKADEYLDRLLVFTIADGAFAGSMGSFILLNGPSSPGSPNRPGGPYDYCKQQACEYCL